MSLFFVKKTNEKRLVFDFRRSKLVSAIQCFKSFTTQTVKQDFGLGSIELSYSRPNVKGRTVFGDLVPYGSVWRTGANSATTLNFSDEVSIGNTKLAAGKYGLSGITATNKKKP